MSRYRHVDAMKAEGFPPAMAEHMRTELVSSALEAAAELRGCAAGALFRSDRGAQYLSGD